MKTYPPPMRKAHNIDHNTARKRYSTPSSTASYFDFESALLDISDWEHGGSFAMEPDGETDILP